MKLNSVLIQLWKRTNIEWYKSIRLNMGVIWDVRSKRKYKRQIG